MKRVKRKRAQARAKQAAQKAQARAKQAAQLMADNAIPGDDPRKAAVEA
ncbi:hypothetical protein LTSEALA_2500, partial [Salmonella enterica subsp. enterica serovar Alachua str. R6-377]